MVARKKKSVRKTVSQQAAKALRRVEAELPKSLREYGARVRRHLGRLEREIERAQTRTRKQAARLLRDASHTLGGLEARGETQWRKLTAPYRRQALQVLRRLEKQVAPPRPKPRARKAAPPKPVPRPVPAVRPPVALQPVPAAPAPARPVGEPRLPL